MDCWQTALAMRHSRGITLIELMVVVVIIAILAFISVPSYRHYMLRANRTDAMTTLLQIHVAQERFFLQNNRYATSLDEVTAAPPGGLGISLGAGNATTGGFYVISLPVATNTSYTAQAAATGGQAEDIAACRTFSINHQGTKAPAASDGCWR